MPRQVAYDLTHLAIRQSVSTPAGIDRVDLNFAQYFAEFADGNDLALRYGNPGPRVLPVSELRKLVRSIELKWERSPIESRLKYTKTREWITESTVNNNNEAGNIFDKTIKIVNNSRIVKKIFKRDEFSLPAGRREFAIPKECVYLNVAQFFLEFPRYFHWLKARSDVRAVFFVHDLLPLDFPEFWPSGEAKLFSRRVDTIFAFASAVITSSNSVTERVSAEWNARGAKKIPVLTMPLPPQRVLARSHDRRDDDLAAHSYFVVIGTIEPRKNHDLLLNVWRSLSKLDNPPKLIVIGARGWESQHTIGTLERSPAIKKLVLEIGGLLDEEIHVLLANSCALLMPSFAEGFGLPILEALTLGVPVIASDLPVFRETSEGKALFLDPTDGPSWLAAILALADRRSPAAAEARNAAAQFRPTRRDDYFAAVRSFCEELQ